MEALIFWDAYEITNSPGVTLSSERPLYIFIKEKQTLEEVSVLLLYRAHVMLLM